MPRLGMLVSFISSTLSPFCFTLSLLFALKQNTIAPYTPHPIKQAECVQSADRRLASSLKVDQIAIALVLPIATNDVTNSSCQYTVPGLTYCLPA